MKEHIDYLLQIYFLTFFALATVVTVAKVVTVATVVIGLTKVPMIKGTKNIFNTSNSVVGLR